MTEGKVASSGKSAEQPIVLPPVREDLRLYPGSPQGDGSPTWRILDPVRNSFFEIGWLEFELLARWREHSDAASLIARVGAETTLKPALDEVQELIAFLANNQLLASDSAVARQALCAMVVPDHPLAGRNELRLRDCLAFPLALADTSLAGRGLIEQVLANASFDLDPRLVSNSVEAMKAFAHMNRGVCFQFRSPGKALIPPGDMIALPLVDPPLLQARLLLATRRSRVLPVAAAAFVEQLKGAFG